MQIKTNYIVIPLITIAVAGVGSWLTSMGMDWYDNLNLPAIAPAGSFIGLVWTVIFILSTISAIMFWNAPRGKNFKIIVGLFLSNAVLNVLWSFLFFTLHIFWWSIFEMIILNVVNLSLIILLYKNYRKSSLLLIPYFLWVTFATYLAYTVAVLNG
jgi:tryptophan-rich sensory protein